MYRNLIRFNMSENSSTPDKALVTRDTEHTSQRHTSREEQLQQAYSDYYSCGKYATDLGRATQMGQELRLQVFYNE